MLGAGLCGALTTFSAPPVEAIELAHDGNAGTAAAYLALTVAAGLALVAAGARLVPGALRRPATG